MRRLTARWGAVLGRALKRGATYIAKITTAAKDTAGNALDQTFSTAGNQPKSWRFKVE